MRFFDQLIADVRFALRSLSHARGFTIVALVTLILGIASVTSIFSYFNAVYYGKLPYGDAARIVGISEQRPKARSFAFSSVSLDALYELRRPLRSFERVSAYDTRYATILIGTEPHQVAMIAVDTSFIPLFGIRAQLGRTIAREEIAGDARVAMISEVLWRSRYGQDPSAVGRRITLGAHEYQIVGVLPTEFRFPYQTDAVIPLRETPDSGSSSAETFVSAIGKLRPGASRAGARAELAVVARGLTSIDSKIFNRDSLIVRDEMLDRKAQQFLPLPSLFLGAGFLLLLIACANVTNLFYVRAAQRRGEMAIRASLGAGRPRLVRHALTESLLISGVAAVFGTILAQWLVRLWLHFVPTQGFPSWFHVAVDLRVLAFAITVTALVTIVVGLAPAREGTRFDLVRALKGAGDGGASGANVTRGSKRGLVLQLGMSMALFISASLLVRSFQKLTSVDVGYPAARIASIQPLLDRLRYPKAQQNLAFAVDIADRAATLPGVTGTAVRGYFYRLRDASTAAGKAEAAKASTANVDRYDPRIIPDRDSTRAYRPDRPAVSYVVSDDYFRLLGLRVHAGRTFSAADVPGGPAAAVIGANTAAVLWGKGLPLGRTIQLGRYTDPMVVVGVVDDVHDLRGGSRGFNDDAGVAVYVSTRQGLTYSPQILARGSGDVLEMRGRIVDLVRAADPMAIMTRETTMASQLDQAFLVTRVFGGVIAALAAAALALSIIGIYGVVAFGITQRTRELGIRIALGGSVEAVMRLILRETLRFVFVGIGVGLLLAVALGRLLKVFLFGVSALDPLTYAVVAVLFGSVALAASWWPARRVMRIDPLMALRAD